MTCKDVKDSLALYADDGLTAEARSACYQHLEVCPVCRQHLADLRSLRRGLATLPRPAIPRELAHSINRALMAEAAANKRRREATFGDLVSEWLWQRTPRYAFSSVLSLVLFAAVFLALAPQLLVLQKTAAVFDAVITPNEIIDPRYDIRKPIPQESYSAGRAPYNVESPSLNPSGALASLGRSDSHTRTDKRQDADDMVVVADVFSNGAASLADIMQAPRDRRMLVDFQKALREDAAFVPASLDGRPGTMRVVYSVHRVDVRGRNY